MFQLWCFIALVLAGLIYFYILKSVDYWKKRGVTSVDPWFAYKNLLSLLSRQISLAENITNYYNSAPNARYVASVTFNKRQFYVRDLNLIKQITVKDFDHFINREKTIDVENDPFFAINLASLENQKWRDMRATLTPTFTSSKMKFIYGLMNECALNFTKYFERNENEAASLEVKNVFSRFAMDVIATSAFGISINSLENKENEFYKHGKEILSPKGLKLFFIFLGIIIPLTRKIFRAPFVDKNVGNFFKNVINETIDVRKKNNVIRPDMIHLLLQTQIQSGSNKQGSNKTSLTNEEITAQGIMFFAAGFETVSTALSFLSYELAVNEDIQNKLQAEIDEAWSTSRDGQISYETLMNLKYLDMVISESLRKWPPAVLTDRSCKKDYMITAVSEDERSAYIPKGTQVFIPIYPIHRDPNYFPNPDVFDPERFNEQNTADIVSGSYMPFGAGPRSCIASRFALMEMKVLMLHLLFKFKIDKTSNTPIPIVIDKTTFNLAAEGGMWLKFSKRSI